MRTRLAGMGGRGGLKIIVLTLVAQGVQHNNAQAVLGRDVTVTDETINELAGWHG